MISAPTEFNLADLPETLRFDGVQKVEGAKGWLQFTELDKSKASFAASFYLQEGEASIGEILARRVTFCAKFEQASPTR